jgi:beta-galactosidase
MKVLIRPGPYVCAEWDFGGLPARLLSEPGLEIRSRDKKFMEEVWVYFSAVANVIKSHLWSMENPNRSIVMLQIEN